MSQLMNENYTKACDGLDMVRDDLRQALKTASALEGILLLRALSRIRDLTQEVQAIGEAQACG